MSDSYDDTAEWLTDTTDTIERSFEEGGQQRTIEVKEITEGELENIESKAAEGPEAEAEAMKTAIDEYLVRPDVPVEDIPMGKRNTLFIHMQLAWSGLEGVEAALDDINIDGLGNR